MQNEEKSPAISDVVSTAIDGVLTARGGGFVTGMVGCAQIVDTDGSQGLIIFTPSGQAISTSLGLVEFLREDAKLDARSALLSCECDDEDEDG